MSRLRNRWAGAIIDEDEIWDYRYGHLWQPECWIEVNRETWDWLLDELDKPPKVLPKLAELMKGTHAAVHTGEDHQPG